MYFNNNNNNISICTVPFTRGYKVPLPIITVSEKSGATGICTVPFTRGYKVPLPIITVSEKSGATGQVHTLSALRL